jgi:hypothetical protein
VEIENSRADIDLIEQNQEALERARSIVDEFRAVSEHERSILNSELPEPPMLKAGGACRYGADEETSFR